MRGPRRVAIAVVAFAALAVPAMVAAADEQPADQATTTQPLAVPPAPGGAPDGPSPAAEPGQAGPAAAKSPAAETQVTPRVKASSPTATAAGQKRNVVIQEPTASEFRFFPRTLEIKRGETVEWTNETSEPHTVTAKGNRFKGSGNIAPGETYDQTFSTAGTFAYFCKIHPSMTGRIVVGSTSGGDALTSGSGSDSGGSSGDAPPLSTFFGGGVGSDTSSGGSSSDGSSGGSLPSTGSDSMILALLGADLLLAGLVLRESLRRRRA